MAKQYQAHSQGTNANDFSLTTKFTGYFEKEDITTLPPGCLVEGSQNVLSNTDGTFGNRKGYTRIGATNTTIAPIRSAFSWKTSKNYERQMRSGNTKLQFLYNGTWYDLLTGLTDAQCFFNYTTFWTLGGEDLIVALFVNKTPRIYEWGGGITTIASNTATTLTKQGTTSWQEEGFYTTTAGRAVTVNGISYTYTGGETTTTLTGLTALPAFTVGDVVTQSATFTLNSAMTAPTGYANFNTFENTNIQTSIDNHIFLSAWNSPLVALSRANNYKSFSFSALRLPGEGGLVPAGGTNPIFISQEETMYVSAGTDQWSQAEFKTFVSSTSTTASANETFKLVPLKTSQSQGALNNGSVFKVKNSIFFLNNETSMDELGRVVANAITPQFQNYSDPVKDLFDRLDFTNASGIYYRYNIYIAVPAESLVLIYNIAKTYWEPPQTLPISVFSIIDGELCGHSNAVPETYKLFDGYSDLGIPTDCKAFFSYQNFGTRGTTKYFNEYYTEGYISSNATLNIGWNLDIDGCKTTITNQLDGSDTQFVCVSSTDASLGKVPLGKNPLGGSLTDPVDTPKFRRVDTGVRDNFYEMQPFFTSYGKDFAWTILAFGPKVTVTNYVNVAIKT